MIDRFKNYDQEVQELVLAFEEMVQTRTNHYFDEDQLLIIADYYLDSFDESGLKNMVIYGENNYPQSVEVRLRRAHLLTMKEKFEEARQLLHELEREDPSNTNVMYALGAVYSALDNPRKSINYYQKASVDGYQLDLVYANIADEYVRLGMEREAIGYYLRSIKINPKDERALYNLCNAYRGVHRETQGIGFFQQFVEDHPYSKSAWFCLGLLYQDQSLWEKAFDAYEFATTIDNKFLEAYTNKADCCFQLHDIRKAISVLREALDYVEEKTSVYALIAQYYLLQENYDTAILYLKEAIKLDPSEGPLHMAMASCYAQLNEYYLAMDYMKRAFEESPDEPLLLLDAARIYAHFDDKENAIKHYEEGLKLFVFDDACWLEYADYLMEHNYYEEAIDVLNRGLLSAYEPLDFNLRLASCYFQTNRRNQLFNALRACQQSDENAFILLLEACPEMMNDLEVMNILQSK